MLTQAQVQRVWEKKILAEVRSLYFADLAASYTKRQQILTGLVFFLSSGAATTAAVHLHPLFPVALSSITAACAAYSIAVGLDKKAAMMAKLHSTWNQLTWEYEQLWNHWYEHDAEIQFNELVRRARDASELGSTEAPYDEARRDKWEYHVYQLYTPSTEAEPRISA